MTLGILMVAALATRVVPVISSGPIDELRDAALEECSRIGAAVRQFASDTGRLPGSGSPEWLHGEGLLPAAPERDSLPPASPIRLFLAEGDPQRCGPFWDGPYLMRLGPDPWGHAYVVARPASGAPEATLWVLSAGPNGRIDTVVPADGPAGDDVGLPVR